MLCVKLHVWYRCICVAVHINTPHMYYKCGTTGHVAEEWRRGQNTGGGRGGGHERGEGVGLNQLFLHIFSDTIRFTLTYWCHLYLAPNISYLPFWWNRRSDSKYINQPSTSISHTEVYILMLAKIVALVKCHTIITSKIPGWSMK